MTKFKVWLAGSPIITIVVALGVAVSSNVAFAQVTDSTSLGTVLCNVISWMIWILLSVSVIMILYAAFLYVTGGDDAEKISGARRTITWAAVGLVVGLIAKTFPQIVISLVGSTAAHGNTGKLTGTGC